MSMVADQYPAGADRTRREPDIGSVVAEAVPQEPEAHQAMSSRRRHLVEAAAMWVARDRTRSKLAESADISAAETNR
jgi:hypothetical protein